MTASPRAGENPDLYDAIGEVRDGSDLGGETCASLGVTGGTVGNRLATRRRRGQSREMNCKKAATHAL